MARAEGMRSACVVAYPRAHMTLVDLGRATGRSYGGAGFAVDGFPTTAIARLAPQSKLACPPGLEKRDVGDLAEAVRRVSRSLGLNFEVGLSCEAPPHSGFGTKTSCVLATLSACNVVAGSPLGRDELVRLSGRGGTSGIGVNTAFVGGFVADAGHPAGNGGPFRPSSAARSIGGPPPATVTLRVPDKWRVHLFLPEGNRVAGSAERDFFSRNTPLPREEVLEVLSLVYHGVAPAIASGRVRELRTALQGIHAVGFKKREVANQATSVSTLLTSLDRIPRVAAGMSSLGPMVYAIAGAKSEDLKSRFESRYGKAYLGEFRIRNQGSEVRDSPCQDEPASR